MIHNLQALGACFAICVLTLIGTTQGTSYPAPKCCSIAIPIEGLCICKPGYHDDGIRHCVEKAKFQFARSSYIVKENSVTVKLQVDRLRGGHSGPVKINWRATGITATANQDFRDLAGTLEFKANENWKVISITIVDDRIYELTEKFKVTLTSTSATGELGPRSFTFVSILNNDPKPKFQFKLTSVQARENCKTLKLQVDRIAGGSTGPATVIWKATGITATPGKDFLDLSGKLYFKANENWKVISIRIVDDRINEPTERFRVTLFSSSTVEIGPNRFADVSILDNDPIAKFQFARISQQVKENGVTVKLQVDRVPGGNAGAVDVYWKADGLSATFGKDFSFTKAPLKFKAGENWKSIVINIIDDKIHENTEQFKVTLTGTSAGGGVDSRRVTTVSILDNDPIAKFQFARTSQQVQENGVTVKLQVDRIPGGNSGAVDVYWKADGLSATFGKDFSFTKAPLKFKAGENWKSIVINIIDDKIHENTEQFKVTLTGTSAGGGVDSRRVTTVSILDNDPIAKFQFARTSQQVQENGVTVKLQVDRVPGGNAGAVDVYWKADGLSATFGKDFSFTKAPLKFKAGENWKSIVINIIDDKIHENTEQFKVTLTGTSAGGGVDSRRVTTVSILDNDPIAKFQFARTSQQVQENGVTVKLQVDRVPGGNAGAVDVYWKADGLSATFGKDFSFTKAPLKFKAGENWKSIVINIIDDKIHENTEQFKVTLTGTSAGGGVDSRRVTTVSILDNDPIAKFQFARISQQVQENGVTVKLQVDRIPGGNSGAVDVYWKADGLSATFGKDFSFTKSPLKFNAGENWKSIVINIIDDNLHENTEQFKVTLTGASAGGGVGPRKETTVSILDNDLPCGGKCHLYKNSICDEPSNRCVCKENFYGNPYAGGCRCGGGGGY